jgi:nucleotide-binding universal stress UspA family protein
MKKRLKILVATDYSELALPAETYAINFAKDTGSFLEFVHVFDPPLATPLAAFDAEKIEYSPLVFEGKKLKNHVANVLNNLGNPLSDSDYTYVVREGSAGTQILEEAQESEIDIIIIGTHGVSGFREFFIGSHSWDVIKNSKIPALAIPPKTVYKKVNSIAFASEYREGEIPAIQFAQKLSNFIKATFKIVHVNNPFIRVSDNKDLFLEFNSKLQIVLKNEAIAFTKLDEDDVAEGIDKFCNESSVDWLVMSPEVPSLLEKIFIPNVSMTRKMSFLTSRPLLAVPDYYRTKSESFWKILAKDVDLE